MRMLIQMRRYAAVALLLAVFSLVGCKTGENPVTGNSRVMGYSWAQEKKLGAQAHQQVKAQYGFYDEGGVQGYVDRVGQRVLQKSHLRRAGTSAKFRNTEVTFRVLDSPIVNAFALPGGYVYVSRGLMSYLNNEAQLAMVMGHEIGHVAARHASQQAGEQQLRQIGLLGGAVVGSQIGLPAGQLLQAGGTALQLLSLKYSRSDEEEADKLGVEYSTMAGYEAREGADFFGSLKRINEQSGQSIPTWQSTHPDPGDRQERIPKLAQQWKQKVSNPATTVNQAEYFNVIDGMVIGQNPRQGFVRNNTFYHPEGEFQFPIPRNFQVQNSASAVIMANQDQNAIMQFGYSQANSPQGAAQQFAQQDGIRVREQGGDRSNGMSAYYVVADAQSQNQQIRLLAYFVEKDGTVYQFLGYSSPRGFQQYRDTFLQTMRGFDEVRDRDILDVEPTRLDVEKTRASRSFRSFVDNGDSGLSGIGAQDLAIMNQVGLDQTISAGRPIKLKAN